jgi:hypothetical protein
LLLKRLFLWYFIPLETFSAETGSGTAREIVLCQGEAAKRSHQNLFSLDDSCYCLSGESIVASILSINLENISKLHISTGWEAMLEMALWTTAKPLVHDVIVLLKRAGIGDDEIGPFKKSEVNDIFPWLYYGKRFDVLRRICNTAKTRIDSKLERKKLLVYCHLSMDEMGRIVASNL